MVDNIEIIERKRSRELEELLEKVREEKFQADKRAAEAAEERDKAREEKNQADKRATEEKFQADKRAAEAAEDQRRQTLVWTMENYIKSTLSTSSKSENINGDKYAGVIIQPMDYILSLEALSLVCPLDNAIWCKLRDNVTTHLDFSQTERNGVHKTILEIVQGCIDATKDCLYTAQYEGGKNDDEGIFKIPDISIVKNDDSSKLMISTVIPIEIKKNKKLSNAIHQSLGYLLSKLRDQFEIAASGSNKLFGFCLGTDGTHLSLGYIVIRNCSMEIFHTGENNIPLWHENIATLRSIFNVLLIFSFTNNPNIKCVKLVTSLSEYD